MNFKYLHHPCKLYIFAIGPIKLLIKRVESEDEISDSPASRAKSKRTRQPRLVRVAVNYSDFA